MSWGTGEQGGWRKGPWTAEEDKLLAQYVSLNGEGRWTSVARSAGLNRNGKSCRLRWVNYLKPGLKRSKLTPQEEGFIVELHALWGNKWSTIARYLPGRTDNEIKNYWRTHFKKGKPSNKQEKRKLSRLQQHNEQLLQQEQDNDGMIIKDDLLPISSASDQEVLIKEKQGNHDAAVVVMEPPLMEDLLRPLMFDDQDVGSWSSSSDTMAEDISLWDGLWNLDEETLGECNNTVVQNPADINAYSCMWREYYCI